MSEGGRKERERLEKGPGFAHCKLRAAAQLEKQRLILPSFTLIPPIFSSLRIQKPNVPGRTYIKVLSLIPLNFFINRLQEPLRRRKFGENGVRKKWHLNLVSFSFSYHSSSFFSMDVTDIVVSIASFLVPIILFCELLKVFILFIVLVKPWQVNDHKYLRCNQIRPMFHIIVIVQLVYRFVFLVSHFPFHLTSFFSSQGYCLAK